MPLRVGTIVKWHEPADIDPNEPEGLEECQDGICVGIIRKITDAEGNDIPDNVRDCRTPDFYLEWWQLCPKHQEIDPTGTGPYQTDFLWEIGQTN